MKRNLPVASLSCRLRAKSRREVSAKSVTVLVCVLGRREQRKFVVHAIQRPTRYETDEARVFLQRVAKLSQNLSCFRFVSIRSFRA